MKRIFALLLILLYILLSGCRTQSQQDPNGLLTPFITATLSNKREDNPIRHTVENGQVIYSLILDKAVFSPGEAINVTAQIDNQGTTSIDYLMGSLEGPIINILVDSEFMQRRSLRESLPVTETHPVETTATLDEKQSLSRQVVWDQSIAPGVQAPPGEYQIIAIVHLVGEEDDVFTFAANFRIEGSQPLISQGEVLSIVISDPVFLEWYNAIGSQLICELWGHEQVALLYSEVEDVTDDIRASMSTEMPLLCNIQLEKGPIWRVAYANKYGPLEGSYWLLIDATNGEILEKSQHGD